MSLMASLWASGVLTGYALISGHRWLLLIVAVIAAANVAWHGPCYVRMARGRLVRVRARHRAHK